MGRNEDDGQSQTAFQKTLLDFQPAHIGHAHVQHQAPWIVAPIGVEKLAPERKARTGRPAC